MGEDIVAVLAGLLYYQPYQLFANPDHLGLHYARNEPERDLLQHIRRSPGHQDHLRAVRRKLRVEQLTFFCSRPGSVFSSSSAAKMTAHDNPTR